MAALCSGEANASSSTGDHGGLSVQSVHLMHPSLELYESSELLLDGNGDGSGQRFGRSRSRE
jgi:hypothetical protein